MSRDKDETRKRAEEVEQEISHWDDYNRTKKRLKYLIKKRNLSLSLIKALVKELRNMEN